MPPIDYTTLDPRPSKPDAGDVRVVVETPKGSRNKLDLDPALGVFILKKVLPAGTVFPFDFGFIPGTLGGDGDPLDVLVFLDEPTYPGVVVDARLVGVLEAEQTDADGTTKRNDRLLAVASVTTHHAHLRDIGDVSEPTLAEVEHFFRSYKEMEADRYEIRGRAGAARARALVDDGVRRRAEQDRAQ